MTNLVGIHEIAQMAGVTNAAVVNWRVRYPDFPKPLVELAMGPVFLTVEILVWLHETGRITITTGRKALKGGRNA